MKFQVRYSRLVSTHVILFPLFLGRKLHSRKIICRERERKKERQTENIRLQIPPFLHEITYFLFNDSRKKKKYSPLFNFLLRFWTNLLSLSLFFSLELFFFQSTKKKFPFPKKKLSWFRDSATDFRQLRHLYFRPLPPLPSSLSSLDGFPRNLPWKTGRRNFSSRSKDSGRWPTSIL